jgi:hypothetical protein
MEKSFFRDSKNRSLHQRHNYYSFELLFFRFFLNYENDGND